MSDGVIKREDRSSNEGVAKMDEGKDRKKEKEGEDFFHYQKSKNQKMFFFL